MSEESGLDVLFGQRLLEHRIVVQINLPNREVVGSSPVGIDQRPLRLRKRGRHDHRVFLSERGRHYPLPPVLRTYSSVVVPLLAMRGAASGIKVCLDRFRVDCASGSAIASRAVM